VVEHQRKAAIGSADPHVQTPAIRHPNMIKSVHATILHRTCSPRTAPAGCAVSAQKAVSLHACVGGGATGLLRGMIWYFWGEPRRPAGKARDFLGRGPGPERLASRRCPRSFRYRWAILWCWPCRCCRASGS